VGGGQDLLGGPPAVGGLADGGDQGRPGGVGDDAGGEVVTEQDIEVAGPGRSQGAVGGGAVGAQVAGLRGQGGGCQVPGQSPPQRCGGHLIRQRARLVPRRCEPRLCCGGGVGVARVADEAGDQGVDVDAGAVGGGEVVGDGRPVRIGEQPRLDLPGQGAPPVRRGSRVAEDAGDPGVQSLLRPPVRGGQPLRAGRAQVVVLDVVRGPPNGEVGQQVAGAVSAEQRHGPGRGAGRGPGAGSVGDLLGEVGGVAVPRLQVDPPRLICLQAQRDSRQPPRRARGLPAVGRLRAQRPGRQRPGGPCLAG